MKTLFKILFVIHICGCAHKTDSKTSIAGENQITISDRLLSACKTVHDFGVSNPYKLAEQLNGKVISDSQIRGPGFNSATFWKNKDYEELEVYFSVEEDQQLTLAELRTRFKDSKTISESKTSSVRFHQIPGPCGELYVSANLFDSKVNEKSAVLSVKLRRPILNENR